MKKQEELKIYAEYDCHMLYDYITNGKPEGQFEVQFDSKKFNGEIYYTRFDSENEDGEFDWEELKDSRLYEMVKCQAIADYNRQ